MVDLKGQYDAIKEELDVSLDLLSLGPACEVLGLSLQLI